MTVFYGLCQVQYLRIRSDGGPCNDTRAFDVLLGQRFAYSGKASHSVGVI